MSQQTPSMNSNRARWAAAVSWEISRPAFTMWQTCSYCRQQGKTEEPNQDKPLKSMSSQRMLYRNVTDNFALNYLIFFYVTTHRVWCDYRLCRWIFMYPSSGISCILDTFDQMKYLRATCAPCLSSQLWIPFSTQICNSKLYSAWMNVVACKLLFIRYF